MNTVPGLSLWLDVSMKRFAYVHPAGGNEYTSVKIAPDELEQITGAAGWCDVCKDWPFAEMMHRMIRRVSEHRSKNGWMACHESIGICFL